MDEYTLDFMYRAGFVEMPRVEYSMGGVVEGGIMATIKNVQRCQNDHFIKWCMKMWICPMFSVSADS